MAKKRVHEIAKERGIPSKEVIAKLQAAGLDVKAAASSVDEADIAMAFDGGPGRNGGATAARGRGTRPRTRRRASPPPRPRPPRDPPAAAARAPPPEVAREPDAAAAW